METKKAILIHLSSSLVHQLDDAASVLNMAWVDVIRRSRMRDLQYVVSEELKRTRRYQQNEHKRYLQWATLKAKITYWKGNCFMSGHLGKRSPPTLPSLMTRVGDWGVLAVIILAPSPLPLCHLSRTTAILLSKAVLWPSLANSSRDKRPRKVIHSYFSASRLNLPRIVGILEW